MSVGGLKIKKLNLGKIQRLCKRQKKKKTQANNPQEKRTIAAQGRIGVNLNSRTKSETVSSPTEKGKNRTTKQKTQQGLNAEQ